MAPYSPYCAAARQRCRGARPGVFFAAHPPARQTNQNRQLPLACQCPATQRHTRAAPETHAQTDAIRTLGVILYAGSASGADKRVDLNIANRNCPSPSWVRRRTGRRLLAAAESRAAAARPRPRSRATPPTRGWHGVDGWVTPGSWAAGLPAGRECRRPCRKPKSWRRYLLSLLHGTGQIAGLATQSQRERHRAVRLTWNVAVRRRRLPSGAAPQGPQAVEWAHVRRTPSSRDEFLPRTTAASEGWHAAAALSLANGCRAPS